MRTVRWTEKAQSELRETIAYIADDSPYYAQTIRDRINGAAHNLGRYNTGRIGRQPGTFEKLVPGLPYILVFRVEGIGVEILHLLHTARDYPPR